MRFLEDWKGPAKTASMSGHTAVFDSTKIDNASSINFMVKQVIVTTRTHWRFLHTVTPTHTNASGKFSDGFLPTSHQPHTTMNKGVTIASIFAVGFLSYAAYFDYNRRNSPSFRKQLKRSNAQEKKQAAKAQEESRKSKMLAVKEALIQDLAKNPLPTGESKEGFFMEQVATGEQLANKANNKIEAALCFYKALAVYPNPTDIMGIYQNTVPEDVYELLVIMIAIQPPSNMSGIIGGADGVSGAASAAASMAQEVKPSEADLD